MKYKMGDIIVYKKESHRLVKVTALILNDGDILRNKDTSYHVVTNKQKFLNIAEESIISYGKPENIITDVVLKEVLDPDSFLYQVLKCVAIHLINTSDKYDLQLLAKCNYQKRIRTIVAPESIQTIIDMIKSKRFKVK